MPNVKMVGGDTMNLWINISASASWKTLKEVDILLINDGEAKLLAGDSSLPRAARKMLDDGSASAGDQARRVRRDDFLSRRHASVSRAGAAD